MEEKGTEFFEKYELAVTGSMRVRGAFRIETETGPKLLLPYGGSEARAEFEQGLLGSLREQGFWVDDYIRNKEGMLVTKDEYGEAFLMKNWYYGEECNLKHPEQVKLAVQNLAALHKCMYAEKPAVESPEKALSLFQKELPEIFEKRNRELRRVRSFLREKRRRSFFENLYINTFPDYFRRAEEVLKYSRTSGCTEFLQKRISEGAVCHENYTHHNLLFLREGYLATVNFEKACFGIQIFDFALFFRKLMEKNNWNLSYAEELIETYRTVREVEKEEWKVFFLLLAYPEKFWKISNGYFNAKKTWIPMKTTEKLQLLLNQERDKQEVLEKVIQKYC